MPGEVLFPAGGLAGGFFGAGAGADFGLLGAVVLDVPEPLSVFSGGSRFVVSDGFSEAFPDCATGAVAVGSGIACDEELGEADTVEDTAPTAVVGWSATEGDSSGLAAVAATSALVADDEVVRGDPAFWGDPAVRGVGLLSSPPRRATPATTAAAAKPPNTNNHDLPLVDRGSSIASSSCAATTAEDRAVRVR
jgi:hypothetical protein